MLLGVVGKPSSGKSTFFNAATMAGAETGDYPFTTIKPNEAMGYVRIKCVEDFFKVKCNPREGYCVDGQRFIPVKLLDVAGLIPGAHEGKGMGNQFLDDLRQGHALIHVVDASGSTNEKGENVKPGDYDPVLDIEFLEEELNMWFLGIVQKGWNSFAKSVKPEEIHKALAKQLSGLGVTEELAKSALNKLNISDSARSWTEDDLMRISVFLRKITKPIIIAANKIDIETAEKNIPRLKEKFSDYTIVPCSGMAEIALKKMNDEKKIKYIPGDSDFEITGELNEKDKKILQFIKDKVLKVYGSTGVQKVLNTAVFDFLKYVHIFPGSTKKLGDRFGNILPDCFLLPPNSTALDFAYHIHSDLGDKFIKAINVKEKRTVGKEYLLKNGDVIEIINGR